MEPENWVIERFRSQSLGAQDSCDRPVKRGIIFMATSESPSVEL